MFKGKDGKDRFAMNPQVGKSMFGGDIPGLAEDQGAAPEDSEYMEIHHGGNPQGSPPMDESHQYHTIHNSATGQDIRNHSDYDDAEAHCRECIAGGGTLPSEAESLDDQGDYDQGRAGEGSNVFA
jgi:hypothetical protein